MKGGEELGHERSNTDLDQSLHHLTLQFRLVTSQLLELKQKSVMSTWQELPQADRGKKIPTQ